MRVSVSRSKNFPRPTSSSNFLSHPHACTPSFPSPPTTVVEKLNDPPVKKRPRLIVTIHVRFNVESLRMNHASSDLKGAHFFPLSSPPPSPRQYGIRRRHPREEVGSKDAILSAPRLSSPIIHSLFWGQGVVYVGRPRWKDNRARSEERGGLLISRRSTIIIGNGTRHDWDEEKWGSVPKERKDGFLRNRGNSSRFPYSLHDVIPRNNVSKKIRARVGGLARSKVSWRIYLDICRRLYRKTFT